QTNLLAFEAAEADFRRARQLLESRPDVQTQYSFHVHHGVLRIQQAKALEGIPPVASAFSALPGACLNPAPPNLVLAGRQGLLEQAAEDLQQAIDQMPDWYQAPVNLAVARQMQGDLAEAVRQLDRTMELRPNDANLHRARARLHWQQKNLDAARR